MKNIHLTIHRDLIEPQRQLNQPIMLVFVPIKNHYDDDDDKYQFKLVGKNSPHSSH
jgi:hypothetical protein